MPDRNNATVTPVGQSTEGTEGRRYRPLYSPRWERERAWLSWKSDGQDHGLRAHRVSPSGVVEKVEDITRQRRKPKAVSSMQWGQC